MSALLLKHGMVVTADGKRQEDVLVGEGEPTETIDCSEKFILPGVVDVHVHFREPGGEQKEDFESGTMAAAAGGVTMVLDMPNNSPAVTSRETLAAKRALIKDKAAVNYGLFMGATADNMDEFLTSDAIALKLYVGSSTGDLLVDDKENLEIIFEKMAAADRLLCVHAEDEALIREHATQFEGQDDPTVHPKIRDEEVEYRSVKMALHLAKKHGTRLHICHLSTARGLREFEEFKSDRITCEVTPHHLFLDESELERQGNFAKMNPPLRAEESCAALMAGIQSGLVNMVATDHAPHTRDEKEQGYAKAPAGVPGVETMLPLLLDAVNHGVLTLEDVVRVTHDEPKRVFGLNLKDCWTVVDMDLDQMVENGGVGAQYTKCGWSPFDGRSLKGWPIMTIVNGEVTLRDGQVFGTHKGRELTP